MRTIDQLASLRSGPRSSRLALAFLCLTVGAGCAPRVVAPAAEGPAGLREKAMLNCPSAVGGAQTTARYNEHGVALDVTADDPAAVRAIIERARRHEAMGAPGVGAAHSGQHGGPGTTGHCPVVHLGTTVSVEEIFQGARITIVATDPQAVPALQHDVRERLAWFAPVGSR